MMNSQAQIAIFAPQQLLNAFSVLVQSDSNLELIGLASNQETLIDQIGDRIPDVILMYLSQEAEGKPKEQSVFNLIAQLKSTWPKARCITIVRYASLNPKAMEMGADISLVDGVDADRLLAAMEGKST